MLLLLLFPVAVLSQCSEVCYPDVECFTNCYPFEAFPHPQSPEEIGLVFYLYTRNGQSIVDITNSSFSSLFDASRQSTIFVIHGFSETYTKPWIQDIKDQLLVHGDYNVLLADWRRGALPSLPDPTAPVPASNARVVARSTRNLIQAFPDLPLENIQCIGFSVGAHACGFLGKEYNGDIGRISALDPAGIIFTSCDETENTDCCPTEECRLSPTDGLFVDAIHTNAWGPAVTSGIIHNVAMVDFWANKGESQPGCGADLTGVCSHERSTLLYTESINSACAFTSDPCDSLDDMRNDNCIDCSGNGCQQMGYNAIDNPGRGTFTLSTNAEPPFCQN